MACPPLHQRWRGGQGGEATRLLKSSPMCASLFCMRTWPHSKAQPTGVGATTQLRRLALSHLSIRGKRHESGMSLVMVDGVLTSSAGNGHSIVESANCTAAVAAPC